MNVLNQTELIRPALFDEDTPVEATNNVVCDGQKLIIQRHLGYKTMLPGSG